MATGKKYLRPKPVVLVTVEGWGVAPTHSDNLLRAADPRHFNDLISHYPALVLHASGEEVGALADQKSGGELGHLVLGLGRAMMNPRLIIDQAIRHGDFETTLITVREAVESGALHIISLLSHAETEASGTHLRAIFEWSQRHIPNTPLFLHLIVDGRDTSAKAGKQLVAELSASLPSHVTIASLCGRLYGLDVHQHDERIELAVQAIAFGQGASAVSAESALTAYYEQKVFDEAIPPTVVSGSNGTIKPGDTLLFCNFDSLSLCQVAAALMDSVDNTVRAFSLGEYHLEKVTPLFSIAPLQHSVGEIIAEAGYRQLRLSDSEGYGLVTAALNGGREQPFALEEREVVQTEIKTTYAETLLAAQEEVTKRILKAISEQRYDFIAVTLSGLDRVGHAGTAEEITKMINAIDAALGKITALTIEHEGVVLIVGSHGLVEHISLTGHQTAHHHTLHPVPFILVGKQFAGYSLGLPQAVGGDLSTSAPSGSLKDIAPTILSLMRLGIPPEMTGKSFFNEDLLV